jgi:hypothetical protein
MVLPTATTTGEALIIVDYCCFFESNTGISHLFHTRKEKTNRACQLPQKQQYHIFHDLNQIQMYVGLNVCADEIDEETFRRVCKLFERDYFC